MTKKKFKRFAATNLIYLVIFIGIIVPLVSFGFRAAQLIATYKTQGMMTYLENSQNLIITSANNFMAKLGVETTLSADGLHEVLTKAGQFLIGSLMSFLTDLPAMTLAFFAAVLSSYFFLIEKDYLKKLYYKHSFLEKNETKDMALVVQETCRTILISSVLIGAVQSFVVALGAVIFGMGDFLLVFIITFICSFVPVLGAAPVGFALAVIGFAESKTGSGVGMVVTGILSLVIEYTIRPMVYKGRTALHPMIALFALIGGIIMLGLPGLFLGPLVASIAINCLPIIFEDSPPLGQSDEKSNI